MTATLRSKYERLLRWYPRAWREDNAEFLLAVLEEDALERGKTKPSVADAWSVRAHGIATRATPNATLGFAAAALMVSLVPSAELFGPLELGRVAFLAPVCQIFLGPVLTFCVVLMVGRRRGGRVTASGALTSICLWALHSLAALAALMSFSVGWDEKNRSSLTEDHTTWFGDSTLLWLAVAGALGVCALTPLFRSLLSSRIPSSGRWTAAAALSVTCLMALFFLTVTPSIAPLLTGALLVLSVIDVSRASADRLGESDRPVPPVTAAQRGRALPPLSSPSEPMRVPASFDAGPRVPAPWRARFAALLVVATVTALMGFACATLAICGSSWNLPLRDSTHAMNVGLALGCLAVLPLAAFGTWMLAHRFGVTCTVGGTFLLLALLLESASQFAGAGHPAQEPLWLLAALCIGASAAIPLSGLVPASKSVGVILAIGGSLVLALTVGLSVPGLPFVAPIASAAVASWAATLLILDARRSRTRARAWLWRQVPRR